MNCASAADAELTAVLLARESERREALVADDMDRFASLIADDVVHVHTTGIVQGKAELLHHASSFLQFLDVERSAVRVRAMGPNAAVMTGGMINTVRRRGYDETVKVEAFVTQVWANRDGRWQIVSFHATRTAGEVEK